MRPKRSAKNFTRIIAAAIFFLPMMLAGQENGPPSKESDFIRVQSPVIALEHVNLIDGTGAAAKPDQTILISGGKITAIGASGKVQIPPTAQRLDLGGYSAIPGLVGMHDHLFYSVNFFGDEDVLAYDMPFSFPRLYLAAGVTTIRTTGAFEPYADLEIKKAIEAGTMIGPKMNVTGPYLDGELLPRIQLHKLTGPDDARRTVDYWADEGVGSFKVWADITRADLKAVIDAAHRRGLTITGHLCSVGFREAAEMGIDGLEHGLFVDTEFASNKQPDVCPDPGNATAADLEISGDPVQKTIRTLVEHHVAVTSTLPVWEEFLPPQQDPPQRVLDALSREARAAYAAESARLIRESQDQQSSSSKKIQRWATMLHKEMEFERAFVKAGGLLLAGPDGVLGADIAGFGDQRELELLVEAGFTPLEAIQIATLNGARFLRQDAHIGSLGIGKQADIVLVKGDPSSNIRDIENVELVFKDGVGYDSQKLIKSVQGMVGIR
jgi:imidazolonepropionase-like amidohydrolase